MKKILIFLLILTTYTYSARIVYDPKNHETSILTKIEAAKQTIEQVEQTKNQIEQLKNQYQQLANEAKNLQQIGKDLSSGNITFIKRGLERIIDFDAQTKSVFFKTEDFLKDFGILYRTSDQISDVYKIGLDEGIEANKKEIERVRKETRNVIFDAMNEGSFNPTLNDKRNLEILIEKASTTEGALEALTVANHILGQMATSLVEIKNILGKSVVVASAVSEEIRQEKIVAGADADTVLDTYHLEFDDRLKKAKIEQKKAEKKVNASWGGI